MGGFFRGKGGTKLAWSLGPSQAPSGVHARSPGGDLAGRTVALGLNVNNNLKFLLLLKLAEEHTENINHILIK